MEWLAYYLLKNNTMGFALSMPSCPATTRVSTEVAELLSNCRVSPLSSTRLTCIQSRMSVNFAVRGKKPSEEKKAVDTRRQSLLLLHDVELVAASEADDAAPEQ